jgi:hypothetical protein
MKKIITTGFFALAIVFFAGAQTVDDIINKHIAAMGGKEKMMSLRTVKTTGRTDNGMAEVFTKKHLAGIRIDRSYEGRKGWMVVTPAKGLELNFGSNPKELPSDVVNLFRTELNLQGPFINYKEKGSKIEMIGKEKVEGADCYKLKVTYKSSTRATYYIDSKTYRLARRFFEPSGDLTYSNYKQNADGYWFPYTEMATKSRGTRTFTKIETNIVVDNKIFQVDDGVF